MKIVVKPKNIYDLDSYIKMKADAFIFGIKDYAVNATSVVSVKTIAYLKKKIPADVKIFVSIDKNLFDKDIDALKKILISLEKININGILFYDIGILKLRDELNMKTPFIWNQNFFVVNYKTINFYKEKLNVNACVLANEITKDEIIKIKKNTNQTLFVNAFGHQLMAYSKRKLITSYFNKIKKFNLKNKHLMNDKSLNTIIKEEKNGTAFITGVITNYINDIKDFKCLGINYIILDENNISHKKFLKVIDIFNKTMNNKKTKEKIEDLFDNLSTGFLYQKTIYKVNRNGKN